MTRVALVFWGLLAVTVAGLYGVSEYRRRHERVEAAATAATKTPEPELMHEIGQFELTERDGQPFGSKDLEGKVWIASFFFTNCPSACLLLNSAISELQRDFDGKDVYFVSVTCDPEHDTPEALAKYAPRYAVDPEHWLFLTGSMDSIAALAKSGFQLTVKQVTHSDRLVLVDRQGKIRGSFRGTDPAQVAQLKERVAELLAEEPGRGRS